MIAGAVLLSTRPFRVGDLVAVQGAGINREGTVASLGLFYTTLLQGRDRVLIPNSVLMNIAVIPQGEPDAVELVARFDSRKVTPDAAAGAARGGDRGAAHAAAPDRARGDRRERAGDVDRPRDRGRPAHGPCSPRRCWTRSAPSAARPIRRACQPAAGRTGRARRGEAVSRNSELRAGAAPRRRARPQRRRAARSTRRCGQCRRGVPAPSRRRSRRRRRRGPRAPPPRGAVRSEPAAKALRPSAMSRPPARRARATVAPPGDVEAERRERPAREREGHRCRLRGDRGGRAARWSPAPARCRREPRSQARRRRRSIGIETVSERASSSPSTVRVVDS